MTTAPPEVALKIDDNVLTRDGDVAVVVVVYADRGEALIRWADGSRTFAPLGDLRLAPSDALPSLPRHGDYR